jgi:hypothetical protein
VQDIDRVLEPHRVDGAKRVGECIPFLGYLCSRLTELWAQRSGSFWIHKRTYMRKMRATYCVVRTSETCALRVIKA